MKSKRVRPWWTTFLFAAALGALFPVPTLAQDATSVPRVFLDCQGPQCDGTYYRTEIGWVTWVRDQQDAHVHIIMTSQGTGVGGREYVLDLMGRDPYGDYEDQLRYQSLPTATQREQLDGVALHLALGIARFAATNGFPGVFQIEGAVDASDLTPGGVDPSAGVLSAAEVQDPWNLWVFRLNANGNFNKRSTRETARASFGFNASRVTPTWIQRYNGNFSYNRQRHELSSGPFTDERHDWGMRGQVVYALAEHWSMGFSSNVGRNTSNNQRIWGQLNPAIEYSYFPYEEATRRSLTLFYEIGPVYRDYMEVTVFGKEDELLAEHALSLEFSQRQPWGNASVRIQGSNYLHSLRRNNISLNGFLSLRVTRGLDLNVGASYSRVRDQLYLPGEDLTDEERLLRLQQEQTEYEASMNFGLSYQFGSIFNNVVNNRFP